jgi:hypothetical protein
MHSKKILVLIVLMFSIWRPGLAQYDSTYIESYSGYLVGRFLVNRKYTTMNISSSRRDYSLRYRPNKTFSAGLGASYRFATLNLTVGILQPQESRGRTRDIDIQLHKYGRKFTVDLLLQTYKGFYLADRSFSPPGEEYYVRPDLAVNAFGGAFQYIFNHRKFSYRAVFQQTESQKKSAGSFLAGFELYIGRFKGDSSIIPSSAITGGPPELIRKLRFIDFGPNGGYAYTWVYKNLFLMASASVSLNATINQVFNEGEPQNYLGVSPNTFFRVATGYDTRKWSVNVILITRGLHFPAFEDRTFNVNSGRYRFNFIYRFEPGRKTKRYLKVIDDVDDFIRR